MSQIPAKQFRVQQYQAPFYVEVLFDTPCINGLVTHTLRYAQVKVIFYISYIVCWNRFTLWSLVLHVFCKIKTVKRDLDMLLIYI